MKKIGFIPLHFVSFLNNEGIDIVDFKSSHQSNHEEYDKMLVRFPYCTTTLDVQVVFDNRNNTLPPDFIVINDGDFFMSYSNITHHWNFRDSSSLYQSLLLLKQLYSSEQERRLIELLKLNTETDKRQGLKFEEKRSGHVYSSRSALFDFIEKIVFYLKSNFITYKYLPKSLQSIDVLQDKDSDTNEVKSVIISYPMDILIRERSIPRAPLLTITIPLVPVTEMKFWIELTLPHFFGGSEFNILKEKEDLANYKTFIGGYEKYVLSQINSLKCRERIMMDIIASNIGFVLEVDSFNFLSFSLFFHFTKRLSEKKSVDFNYLLHFVFTVEDNTKFEMQVVDSGTLTIILRIFIEYDINAFSTHKIVRTVLSAISECVFIKRKKDSSSKGI